MAIQSRSKPTASAKPRPAVAGNSKPPSSMAPTFSAKEAIFEVSTTVLENGTIKGEPVTSESREVKSFVTNTANVGVSVAMTRNLGNYESVKTQVSINMPCYVEELDNAKAQVLDKAKTFLDEALAEFQIEGTATTEAATAEVAEETEAVAEEADGEVTPEYLAEADEETLKALCEANPDFGITADDYPDVEDLRNILSQTIFGEETAGTEDTAEAAEGGEEPYTEEELKAGTKEDLTQIFSQWELGAYPKGPPAVAKAAAIKKIMKAQEAA